MAQNQESNLVHSVEHQIFPPNIFKDDLKEHRPQVLTIGKTPEEVWKVIRRFEIYPLFLKKESIIRLQDIEVVTEEAPRLLVWQSWENGSLKQKGAFKLEPAPGGRGTVVALKVEMESIGNKIEAAFKTPIGKGPEMQAHVVLMKLKAYLETGEVPTTEGQPNGQDEINSGSVH